MIEALDSVKWILQELLSKMKENHSIPNGIIDSLQGVIIQLGEIHNELCMVENDNKQ